MILYKKHSKSSELHYLEPCLYPSRTDIVEAMNTFIQELHNHSKNLIQVEVSRKAQRFEFYLANEGSGLAFFSTELGHIYGCIVGNEFGVMLRRKRPQKPEFASDIVRIHSLMTNTNLIEYNIVDDTKGQLLRCFFSFQSSKLETLNVLDSTWAIRHLATCNSDHCKKFLSLYSYWLETWAVKKYFLYLVVSIVLSWSLKKPPTFISYLKDVTKWLPQDK